MADEIKDQIAAAFQAGDVDRVNSLVASASMNAEQANNLWGSGIADLAASKGVKFAPTQAATTPNTSAPAGLATLQNASNNVYGTTIEDLYKNVLGRAPDAGGLQFWKDTFGDTIDPTEISTFKTAAAPEISAKTATDAWFSANPNAKKEDIVSAVQSAGGLTPQLSSILAQRFETDPNTIESTYNNIIQDKLYDDLVNNAYGSIGRTGIGTATNNIDQAGKDYFTELLKSGTVKPEDFNTVFNNAVNAYKTANPDDDYTKYVKNYQFEKYTDPLKSDFDKTYEDNVITFEEADKIKSYRDNYGFSAEDISRVTGVPLNSVNNVLGVSRVTWENPELKPVELRGKNTWFNPNTGQTYIGKTAAEAANKEFLAPSIKTSLTDAFTMAEKSGDYSNVKDLLKQTGVTGFDINQMSFLTPEQKQKLTEKTGFEFVAPKITYHNGTQYDTKTLMKLAGQLGQNLDPSQLSGGAFGVGRANIGFDPDEFERSTGMVANPVSLILLDAATGLVNQGITDLSQVKRGDVLGDINVYEEKDGETGVPTGRYYTYEGDGENSSQRFLTPAETKNVTKISDGDSDRLIAKDVVTGQGLFFKDKLVSRDTTSIGAGGTYTGPGYTGYGVRFDESGKPTFTTYGESTSDLDAFRPIIAIGAVVPNPYQAYFQAANAAIAYNDKNYVGAVLSGLQAGGTFTGTELASAKAANDAAILAGADTTLTAARVADLTSSAKTISTAQNVFSGLNAIDKGNIAGAFNAGANLYTGTGGVIPKDLKTAASLASAAQSFKYNDTAGFLDAVGNLTQSSDVKVGAAASRVLTAFNSDNPVAIATALQGLTKTVTNVGDKSDIVNTLKNAGLTEGTLPAGAFPTTLADGSVGYFDTQTGTVYNSNGSVNVAATHPVEMISPDGTKMDETVAGPGGIRGSSSTQVQYDSAGKPIGITFIDSTGATKNLPATLDSSGSLTYTENGTSKSVMMDSTGKPITYKSLNDATGKLEDIPVLKDPKTGQPTWKGDVLPAAQYETVWRLQNPEKWQAMANEFYSGVGKEAMSIDQYMQKRLIEEGVMPGAKNVTTVDAGTTETTTTPKTSVSDFLSKINWKGAAAGDVNEITGAIGAAQDIKEIANSLIKAQSSGYINDIKDYFDSSDSPAGKQFYQSLMQELVSKNPSLSNNEVVQNILNADTTDNRGEVVITGQRPTGMDRVVALDADGAEITLGQLMGMMSKDKTSNLPEGLNYTETQDDLNAIIKQATNPSVTPTPTVTTKPTASVTPTVTTQPSATVTPTASVTPSTTVTPTVTTTVTPTVTTKPTTSVTPTTTVTPSVTVTPTVTTTVTTTTPTPTVTPTPTATPTPTVTSEPTSSPTPTPTPTATTKPTSVATTSPTATTSVAQSTGLNFGQVQQALAAAGIPQLANVFYYGKDFGGKKQKLDKKGELEDEEYKSLSVTKAGAAGELEEQVAEEAKTKENDINTALDHILGASSNSTSLDDLLNIVKGA